MDIPILNADIQVLKYGTAQPKYFTPVDSSYQRIDEYTSNKDGEKFQENYLCTGLSDKSPIYYKGYDPNCSCCWLGFGHTEDKHYKSIGS